MSERQTVNALISVDGTPKRKVRRGMSNSMSSVKSVPSHSSIHEHVAKEFDTCRNMAIASLV